MEIGTSDLVSIGDHKGEKKRLRPSELTEDQARHLLGIIRAQASTEFGSIQQHSATLHRAQDDEDRFWVLRVMAEELRHGYQMFHLLLSEDWSQVSGGVKGDTMVEEILSMQTGSHVLDAFNVEYDSFIDNVVFAAVIDRVGKYQLTMQKVCAYKPMADSMPPMLREEAFHLAAGVVPLRRWATRS
jgi:benzoyl-CoA 2,3-epoxidase subunit B